MVPADIFCMTPWCKGGIGIRRSRIRTYKYKAGKNLYIVIKIQQLAAARTQVGNALASNAVNVQLFKSKRK